MWLGASSFPPSGLHCSTLLPYSPFWPPWWLLLILGSPAAANSPSWGHSIAWSNLTAKLFGFTTHICCTDHFLIWRQIISHCDAAMDEQKLFPPFLFLLFSVCCWPVNCFNLKGDLMRWSVFHSGSSCGLAPLLFSPSIHLISWLPEWKGFLPCCSAVTQCYLLLSSSSPTPLLVPTSSHSHPLSPWPHSSVPVFFLPICAIRGFCVTAGMGLVREQVHGYARALRACTELSLSSFWRAFASKLFPSEKRAWLWQKIREIFAMYEKHREK